MTMQITATYAAILAIYFVILSNVVSITRGKLKTPIGDGDNIALSVIIRRHANFAEAVPFALIVMAMAEVGGLAAPWVHALGVLLLAARLIHPFGMTEANPIGRLRIVGAVGTHIVTVAASLAILAQNFLM